MLVLNNRNVTIRGVEEKDKNTTIFYYSRFLGLYVKALHNMHENSSGEHFLFMTFYEKWKKNQCYKQLHNYASQQDKLPMFKILKCNFLELR